VDEIESIVKCIEAGADDYLLKPFNPVLLRARIRSLLDRKRLVDEQNQQRQELERVLENSRLQTERAEQLLLNILPAVVAKELRENGSVKPMYFEDVTIAFADIVGFTQSTEQLPADELVEILNEYFTLCDRIVARYGLEKLKTIGDCYMFAGGIPIRNPSHPVDSVLAATEMISAMAEINKLGRVNWQLRIGINSGPVIAGVVGIHKFAFDIWGDAVNFASRVEACGAPGRINLSQSTYIRAKDFFACEKRPRILVKEGKEVEMYFVDGVAPGLLNKPNMSSLTAFKTRYTTYFRKELETYPVVLFQN
jgi:adenylate cyclase